MNLAAAFYDRLTGDGTLTGMLSTYKGHPAVFTIDPAPEEAIMPYLVTAGNVVDSPDDTKTSRGRDVWRDIRCYATRSGSVIAIEAIAERVRELFHRHELTVEDHETWMAECSGPIKADEDDCYARIITVKLNLNESEGS
ncbi:MAG: hypothetical protein U1E51_31000 [Candidatus Binatia bacterium]|nr:hypothetical protein [Candidatus Binatia bacterium]